MVQGMAKCHCSWGSDLSQKVLTGSLSHWRNSPRHEGWNPRPSHQAEALPAWCQLMEKTSQLDCAYKEKNLNWPKLKNEDPWRVQRCLHCMNSQFKEKKVDAYIMKLFSPARGGMAGGTWLRGDWKPLRTGGDEDELLLSNPFVDEDELKFSSRPTPLLLDELVFIPLLKYKGDIIAGKR